MPASFFSRIRAQPVFGHARDLREPQRDHHAIEEDRKDRELAPKHPSAIQIHRERGFHAEIAGVGHA